MKTITLDSIGTYEILTELKVLCRNETLSTILKNDKKCTESMELTSSQEFTMELSRMLNAFKDIDALSQPQVKEMRYIDWIINCIGDEKIVIKLLRGNCAIEVQSIAQCHIDMLCAAVEYRPQPRTARIIQSYDIGMDENCASIYFQGNFVNGRFIKNRKITKHYKWQKNGKWESRIKGGWFTMTEEKYPFELDTDETTAVVSYSIQNEKIKSLISLNPDCMRILKWQLIHWPIAVQTDLQYFANKTFPFRAWNRVEESNYDFGSEQKDFENAIISLKENGALASTILQLNNPNADTQIAVVNANIIKDIEKTFGTKLLFNTKDREIICLGRKNRATMAIITIPPSSMSLNPSEPKFNNVWNSTMVPVRKVDDHVLQERVLNELAKNFSSRLSDLDKLFLDASKTCPCCYSDECEIALIPCGHGVCSQCNELDPRQNGSISKKCPTCKQVIQSTGFITWK